jgi:hypothetical protein
VGVFLVNEHTAVQNMSLVLARLAAVTPQEASVKRAQLARAERAFLWAAPADPMHPGGTRASGPASSAVNQSSGAEATAFAISAMCVAAKRLKAEIRTPSMSPMLAAGKRPRGLNRDLTARRLAARPAQWLERPRSCLLA